MDRRLDDISNEYRVLAAYDRFSRTMGERGYRFNPVYLASKALCDWAPLHGTDLKSFQVLNIGCGEPIDELHFAERVRTWISIDVNQNIVGEAHRTFISLAHPSLARKVRFSVMDARQLAFPAGTFDVVVSYSTIEHIPGERERQCAYEEVRRVLKPGGLAVITVPNRYSTFRFAHNRNTREGNAGYGYSHLYSVKEFRRCLERAGLIPIKFTSDLTGAISLLSFCPSWLYRILRPIGYLADRIGYVCRAK